MAEDEETASPIFRYPTHPGTVLSDFLPDVGMAKSDIAALLGISRQHLNDILAGNRPVSPDIASRLARSFGGGPELWLRLQANVDAWKPDPVNLGGRHDG